MWRCPIRLHDVIAVMGIVLAFMTVADWKYSHPQQLTWLRLDCNSHLGAEYNDIARAIRSGRGFSDPFQVESGPTAWMAPVLPYVLAGLYWVSGDNRETVVELVLLIKGLVLVLTGLLVVREGRRIGRVWLAYLVLIAGFATHFHQMFQRTHDVWLVLLMVDLTWLGIVRLWAPPNRISAAVVWGWFGGLTALCSPIAGATWAVMTALRWRPSGNGRWPLSGQWLRVCKPLAIAAFCSIAVISPWILRNRLVLGAWIPIKSNCAYEIWQALCLDDDGVVDVRTGVSHPWRSAGEQRAEYVAHGETQFIATRRQAAWKIIRDNPERLLDQCANRALATLVIYQPSEWEKLQWPWVLWLKYAAFALPYVCLLTVMCLGKAPLDKEPLAAMWIYGVYLLPYILISYYDRYAMPLLGIKMLLVVYGFDAVICTLVKKRGLRAWLDQRKYRKTAS